MSMHGLCVDPESPRCCNHIHVPCANMGKPAVMLELLWLLYIGRVVSSDALKLNRTGKLPEQSVVGPSKPATGTQLGGSRKLLSLILVLGLKFKVDCAILVHLFALLGGAAGFLAFAMI